MTISVRENESHSIDSVSKLEEFGSKMKNLTKLQILLRKNYMGNCSFIFPSLKGIEVSNCSGLKDMKIIFDPKDSGENNMATNIM